MAGSAIMAITELDTMRYFLEEAQRRAGNLARSDDLKIKIFGQETHRDLSQLIRATLRVEVEAQYK